MPLFSSNFLPKAVLAAFLTAWVVALLPLNPAAAPVEKVIYSTGFEPDEGYDINSTLAGQQGWVRYGSGGNGIVTNFFENFGQQAFIGFSPPEQADETLNVWRPINVAPIPPTQPLVRFSVLMQIIDSTSKTGPFDDFRWSVYNTNGSRLFTLDFDNTQLLISYGLDDGKGFVSTGLNFNHAGAYQLEIFMNFAKNLWTATLNGAVVANSKPITTAGAALNFGDADAVWAIRQPGKSGDNYMVFDNYEVTQLAMDSIPPNLQLLGPDSSGKFKVRVFGEENLKYILEASSNLTAWELVRAFTAPAGGVTDLEDPRASEFAHRFYRARSAP